MTSGSGQCSRDDGHGVDFQSVAASGEVVDLCVQAEKDGAVSIEVTETLCDLVTDVACVDVGEDEGVCMTCSRPAGNLGLCNTRRNSCVELDLAADRDIRIFLFRLLSGIVHLGNIGILCGAVGGEGKESDLGVNTEDLRALNGLAADLNQLIL